MTLPTGKLPAGLLAELLQTLPRRDLRVRVGPGIGRDAAVIHLGDRLIVAKTDPITFATEDIGWYAVHVNANDVACMGAKPEWFLATALLPAGAPESLARSVFEQLVAACDAIGVELVGGHAEITDAVDRPVVCGAMIGEAAEDQIVDPKNVSPGDIVLLTKGVAIEGTSLLAREAAAELRTAGVGDELMNSARGLLHDPGISVVADARAVCAAVKPGYLHDPTEGGIVTALHEAAAATEARLRVDMSAIPVLRETSAVCDALGLDPLGLLASGALLAIVPAAEAERAREALADAGSPCATIGEVERGRPGVIIDGAKPLPTVDRDELARYFERRPHAGDTAGEPPEGMEHA